MESISVTISSAKDRDKLIKVLSELQFEEPSMTPLPKAWEELKEVKGWYVSDCSEIEDVRDDASTDMENTFKTEVQAKSAIAKAKLSQVMAVYNDGWEPNWNDDTNKHIIKRTCDIIVSDTYRSIYSFLAFKTKKLRNEFLENFEEDINIYFEL